MQNAVAELYRLGHRRIGFLPGGIGYNYTKLRTEGYLDGLAKVGLELDAALIGPNAVNKQQGADATHSLLCQDIPPTAILCSVDHAAIGAYDAIRSMGLEVGKEVSVIAYDGVPEGAILNPQLSTYAVDTKHAARALLSC